jgi:hypothetical protein
VDTTGTELWPVVGFGISSIEPTGFITRVAVHVEFNRTGEGSEKQNGND